MADDTFQKIFSAIEDLSGKVDENTAHITKQFDGLAAEVKELKTAITGNPDLGQLGVIKRQEKAEAEIKKARDERDALEKKMLIAGVLIMAVVLGPDGLKLLSKFFI